MTFIIVIIALALIFDFINGFHDAANSIATIVSTKVLTPFQAVVWAAFFNFAAFFISKYVFKEFGIGNTVANLREAAGGENMEWSSIYPGFAGTARGEGFEAIAVLFERVAVAEKQHEKRYRDLLENIEKDRVFKKDAPVTWRCRNCGYIHIGTEAPQSCPACAHPQCYFELLGENW